MEERDYPYIYKELNKKSLNDQKYHFLIIKVEYLLNILIVFTSSFSQDKKILIILIFTIALVILLNLSKKHFEFEKKWYDNRASTESLKSLTWKWVMNSKESESNFEDNLKPFLGRIGNENLITDEMKSIKKMKRKEKFEYYKKNRIMDQERWYLKKKKENVMKTKWFLFITIVSYIILFVVLLYNLFANPKEMININVGFLILLGTIFSSWSNSKKYAELGEAYSITLEDISFLKDEIMDDTDNFNDYISNCENAFSREHTQWFARKKD